MYIEGKFQFITVYKFIDLTLMAHESMDITILP